jgi:hypothetical protein
MPKIVDWDEQIGRRLRLRDLRVFFAVLDSGSLAKAAELLRVSQPAVSQVIGDLEHNPQERRRQLFYPKELKSGELRRVLCSPHRAGAFLLRSRSAAAPAGPVEERTPASPTPQVLEGRCSTSQRYTADGERNLDPDRSDGLVGFGGCGPSSRGWRPPASGARGAQHTPRAKVSTARGRSIPTTLGGRLPPVSILSRREYGLRILRK